MAGEATDKEKSMKENKPKPACYAVFEEDQSIRIWGNHPILIEGLRKKFGDRLRPLYITPQPDPSVSALVEALESSQHGLHDSIDGEECRCIQCKFVRLRDAALAAYRKHGGDV